MRFSAVSCLPAAIFVVVTGFSAQAQNASQLIDALKPTGSFSDTTRGIKPLGPAPAGQGMTGTPSSMQAPAPATAVQAPSANLTVDFDSGSATLTPNATAALDQLGKALTSPQLASYNFKIAGHTDTVGDAAANLQLSQARAAAVKSYLEQKFNISDTRLQAVGLGESDLLIPTPPNTPSQANRRVQIVNLGQ